MQAWPGRACGVACSCRNLRVDGDVVDQPGLTDADCGGEHGWVEPTPEPPEGWEQARPTLGGNAPRPSDPDEPPPTDDDVLGDWVPPHTLPQIIVYAGERHLAVDQGLAALAGGRVPFYQRGQDLVRICLIKLKLSNGDDVRVPAVSIVTLPMLMRALSRCATWCKFNDKKKLVRIDPPAAIGEQIMGMIGEWPFPPLRGVIATPTMRHDGTLLTQPGYDPATGLVLFNPPSMPAIPDQPTKQDALDALAKLNDLLTGFEFADDGNVSRSAAISMLMTPVLRGMMGQMTDPKASHATRRSASALAALPTLARRSGMASRRRLARTAPSAARMRDPLDLPI